ncbi:UNKNOWN [Stylonychia lemnae]|uniref:Uncharacterized protein n=1 Tax=Stylonychia lemnae TaxID=5949 RepID=A0A078B294_STYLE|nr:UNKNOWN [Stylonychia lemnae]|eukprot:CDW87578.1 UNKNOWN [Stylonychia lemnae]
MTLNLDEVVLRRLKSEIELEIVKRLDSKLIEYKDAISNEYVMRNQQKNRDLEEIKSQLFYDMDQISNFMMLSELHKQGYSTVEEFVQSLNSDTITMCKSYVNEQLDAQHNMTVNKFDTFSKEQQIIKSQVELLKDLRFQMSTMNQKLEEKASFQNLRNIEFQLSEYVKIYTLTAIEEDIRQKVDSKEFYRLKEEFQDANSQIQHILRINKTYEETQNQLDTSLKDSYVSIEKKLASLEIDMKRNDYDLQAKTTSIRDSLINYKKEVEQRFNEERFQIMQCVKITEFERLKDSLERYAPLAEVYQLRAESIPVIKKFRLEVEQFKDTYEQVREMIRRFDEIISEKASKSSLLELEFDIGQNYVKKKYWDKLQEQIQASVNQQQDMVKLMQNNVSSFEGLMEDKIQHQVKRFIQKAMIDYERVLNAFQKFFDHEELQKVLDGKANLSLIQNLDEIKASKAQVSNCYKILEQMHDRIRQISILMVETAKTIQPQKNSNNFEKTESLNSKIARRDYLLRLSKLTAQWIEELEFFPLPPDAEPYQFKQRVKSSQVSARRNLSDGINDQQQSSMSQIEKIYKKMNENSKSDLPVNLQIWKRQFALRSQNGRSRLNRKQILQQDGSDQFSNTQSFAQNITTNLTQNQHQINIFGHKKSLQDHKNKSNFSLTLSLNHSPTNDDENRVKHNKTQNMPSSGNNGKKQSGPKNVHHIVIADNNFNINNVTSATPTKNSYRHGSSNPQLEKEITQVSKRIGSMNDKQLRDIIKINESDQKLFSKRKNDLDFKKLMSQMGQEKSYKMRNNTNSQNSSKSKIQLSQLDQIK